MKTAAALTHIPWTNPVLSERVRQNDRERQRINYRLNILLCYSARPLQSEATAEGSFCQRWSSWGGCNVGTDSRGHMSESLIVFHRIIGPVLGCSQLQYHVLLNMLLILLSFKSNKALSLYHIKHHQLFFFKSWLQETRILMNQNHISWCHSHNGYACFQCDSRLTPKTLITKKQRYKSWLASVKEKCRLQYYLFVFPHDLPTACKSSHSSGIPTHPLSDSLAAMLYTHTICVILDYLHTVCSRETVMVEEESMPRNHTATSSLVSFDIPLG